MRTQSWKKLALTAAVLALASALLAACGDDAAPDQGNGTGTTGAPSATEGTSTLPVEQAPAEEGTGADPEGAIGSREAREAWATLDDLAIGDLSGEEFVLIVRELLPQALPFPEEWFADIGNSFGLGSFRECDGALAMLFPSGRSVDEVADWYRAEGSAAGWSVTETPIASGGEEYGTTFRFAGFGDAWVVQVHKVQLLTVTYCPAAG